MSIALFSLLPQLCTGMQSGEIRRAATSSEDKKEQQHRSQQKWNSPFSSPKAAVQGKAVGFKVIFADAGESEIQYSA